jgi:hypothetical protein
VMRYWGVIARHCQIDRAGAALHPGHCTATLNWAAHHTGESGEDICQPASQPFPLFTLFWLLMAPIGLVDPQTDARPLARHQWGEPGARVLALTLSWHRRWCRARWPNWRCHRGNTGHKDLGFSPAWCFGGRTCRWHCRGVEWRASPAFRRWSPGRSHGTDWRRRPG